MNKVVVYKNHKNFRVKDLVLPVLYTLKDLSNQSSNFVFTREDFLNHLTSNYLVLSDDAEARLHKNNHDPLWQHISDLTLSMARYSNIFKDYDYRHGMYHNLTEEAKRFIEKADKDYIVNSVMNNFTGKKNVDIVKEWTEKNPKTTKVTLIKKKTGEKIEREFIAPSGWLA